MPVVLLTPTTLSMRHANVVDEDPRPSGSDALVVEAWAQGYMVGSLIIMSFITIANMRRGIILHKLIFIELILGIWQGFWLFFPSTPYQRVDTWWLSVAAIPLNASWILHNIISWMKVKPFLSRFWSKVMFWTVILSIPYWIVEMYANFAYFHDGPQIFRRTRPLEILFRDPWWVITTIYLFIVIKTQYEMTLKDIVRISPRFGVMLASMVIAIVFVVCDVLSVTNVIHLAGDTGINPFWKFAFAFKCLTDSVILDDFKVALDRLRAFKISRLGSFSGDLSDRRSRNDGNLVKTWEKAEQDARIPANRGLGDLGDLGKYGDFMLPTKFASNDSAERNRGHEDSVIAPNGYTPPARDMDLQLAPEDMAPSTIQEPPMRTLEAAHHSKKDDDEWIEDVSTLAERRFTANSDYAAALRDLQGQASATTKNSSTQHSKP